MCTLIVSFQQHQSAPVLVAANRDELRVRPATAPHFWAGEPFVAPKDEQAGGSWLGLTNRGLFVGVTNRFPSERFPERESRGTLVIEALRASSAQALRASLEGLSATRFNTFHLFFGDRQQAYVSWSDGTQVRHQELTPGLHVITERSLNGIAFVAVAQRGGSTMRVDELHLVRIDASIVQRVAHRAARAVHIRRCHMIGIGTHAIAYQFRVDFSPTLFGAFILFQHHNTRPFAYDEAITINIPGATGGRRVIVARR